MELPKHAIRDLLLAAAIYIVGFVSVTALVRGLAASSDVGVWSVVAVVCLAFLFETVDSSAGMGFGTSLAPLLFVLGFKPLEGIGGGGYGPVITLGGILSASTRRAPSRSRRPGKASPRLSARSLSWSSSRSERTQIGACCPGCDWAPSRRLSSRRMSSGYSGSGMRYVIPVYAVVVATVLLVDTWGR